MRHINIYIKNVSTVKESFIEICANGINLIQTTAEARAMYAALTSLSKPDLAINEAIELFPEKLPDWVTRDKIHRTIIQRNFEEEFYGQINCLFDDSVGEIIVESNNGDKTKFTIANNIVQIDNVKPINNNIIYIREYDPCDSHIRKLMCSKGQVVDVLLNQDYFGHIFDKVGVSNVELTLNQYNRFSVNTPGIREPLHIKNYSKVKLPFLIMKHLIYNNSDILVNGILVVEQPYFSKKRLNLFKELLQLIQARFGTTIFMIC